MTETEVQCFFIDGYHEGERIGHWALGRLAPETSWTLTFDPVASEFVVYGAGAFMPQAWNMNGFGDDCGTEGFGFNIGNAAQDLCLDGKLLVASQIPPERPFPARPDPGARFPSDACAGDLLLSALR